MHREVYNRNNRVHVTKFQSVVTPNGIIANLYGPVEGCRHDSGMLAYSGLLQQLEQHCYNLYQEPMYLYRHPAYPLHVHLQGPFSNPTPDQIRYNKAMSQSRVAVEWVFGDTSNLFSFLNFRKNLKIGISSVGKMYTCCALMENPRSFLYGCTTSNFFGLNTPNLMDYFQ